ncbi:LexA family transcriptional regulator [Azospirillum sp. B506]|uniref:LexA family protein n=1 Tax=Azospirillum sp. B506 TaxID=137721 RepID=UPI00034777D9|nr:hypothetical protein [Azospirillum sp. B506]
MTTATVTMPEETAAMARTIRQLQARNIVLEAEVERLKSRLAAKEPKVTGLTPRQRKLLDFIDQYQRDHRGDSPSFAEMAAGIGLASKAPVHRLLEGMEERGAIVRDRRRARAIRIVATDAVGGAE